MNTRITYLYRDASNYKQVNEVVVKGTLTGKQIDDIASVLHEGEWFIPRQVGLPEIRIDDKITEDDHVFFEIDADDFNPTDDEPTVETTAQELYDNFMKTEGNWDIMLFYL